MPLDGAPDQRVAWVAHELSLPASQSIEHAHEFAFVYARAGPHTLARDGANEMLAEARGAAIESGQTHRHGASSAGSVVWEIRLARPGADPAPKTSGAEFLFESEPLDGIPKSASATFVHVLVPSEGQTSVHTHPGPEFIYQLEGEIEYENALIGAIQMGPGNHEGIPAGVAAAEPV